MHGWDWYWMTIRIIYHKQLKEPRRITSLSDHIGKFHKYLPTMVWMFQVYIAWSESDQTSSTRYGFNEFSAAINLLKSMTASIIGFYFSWKADLQMVHPPKVNHKSEYCPSDFTLQLFSPWANLLPRENPNQIAADIPQYLCGLPPYKNI